MLPECHGELCVFVRMVGNAHGALGCLFSHVIVQLPHEIVSALRSTGATFVVQRDALALFVIYRTFQSNIYLNVAVSAKESVSDSPLELLVTDTRKSARTPAIHSAGLIASHYTAALGEGFGAIISLLFELVLMATAVIEIPRRLDGLAEPCCGPIQVRKRAVAPVSLANYTYSYTCTKFRHSSVLLCQTCQSSCSMLCSPGRVRKVGSYWK